MNHELVPKLTTGPGVVLTEPGVQVLVMDPDDELLEVARQYLERIRCPIEHQERCLDETNPDRPPSADGGRA